MVGGTLALQPSAAQQQLERSYCLPNPQLLLLLVVVFVPLLLVLQKP